MRYDDKYRATCVIMLEAAGYPDRVGALMEVVGSTGVPHTTLARWFRRASNPPPNELVQEKRYELSDLLEREIRSALGEMNYARPDAEYKELATTIGILIDKLQLLLDRPTQRINVNISDDERRSRIAALLDEAGARRTGQPPVNGERVH